MTPSGLATVLNRIRVDAEFLGVHLPPAFRELGPRQARYPSASNQPSTTRGLPTSPVEASAFAPDPSAEIERLISTVLRVEAQFFDARNSLARLLAIGAPEPKRCRWCEKILSPNYDRTACEACRKKAQRVRAAGVDVPGDILESSPQVNEPSPTTAHVSAKPSDSVEPVRP